MRFASTQTVALTAMMLTVSMTELKLAAQEPLSATQEKRLAVEEKLGKLRGIHIEAPRTVVEGEAFELRVTAPVPVSLYDKLELKTLRREPDKLTAICQWPGAVILDTKILTALGIDDSRCVFGVRENTSEGRKDWYLEWVYEGIAKQAGHYDLKGTLGGIPAKPARIHVVKPMEEQLYERVAEIFRTLRPAILIAFGLLLCVVAERVALFLFAFGWMVVATGFGVWSVVAYIAAVVVIMFNHVTHQSLLRQVLPLLARFRKKRDDKEKDDNSTSGGGSAIDRLHERAEELMESSARRARWQLFAGGLLALIAFFVLLLPLRRLAADARHDPETSFRLMLVTGLPSVAVFVCLILGAHVFVQQYRLSLDDHRHFEESLRNREWQRLVLQGDPEKLSKVKELLVPAASPPKPPPTAAQ